MIIFFIFLNILNKNFLMLIINNYNFLYFYKDDEVELIGKFTFVDTNQDIEFNKFYDYNEEIKYIVNSSNFYYFDKIYFLLSHCKYGGLDSYGTIDLNICPSYCSKKCTVNKECYTTFTDNELDEIYYSNNINIIIKF